MESSSGECSICFESYKKFRREITCPSCVEGTAKTCRACVEEYLLGSMQEAHCSICRHTWGYSFMNENFSKTFLIGPYRKSRQKFALEREKALLVNTLPLVEEEKRKVALKEEIKDLTEKRKKLAEKLRGLDDEINARRNNIRGVLGAGGVEAKKKSWIGPCPRDECRGFVDTSFKCGVCEGKICKRCHVAKEPDDGHKCKKSEIASAKAKMEDTKPCPSCKTRIFKIQGCDQMFCTNCHTPFSWQTGEVVKGVIHNPHYYELMQNLGRVRRNAGDHPCGGLVPFAPIMEYLQNCERKPVRPKGKGTLSFLMEDFVARLYRRTGEAQDEVDWVRRAENAAGDKMAAIRLNYLTKRIPTEEAFKKAIFLAERNRQKKDEALQIYDTFIASMTERFNNMLTEFEKLGVPSPGISGRVEKIADAFIKDAIKIVNFCNKAFMENFTAMGYKKFNQILVEFPIPKTLFSDLIVVGREPVMRLNNQNRIEIVKEGRHRN